jgi:ribosome recycling factor
LQKDKEITEDDQALAEKEVQELTDDYVKKVDDILDSKEKEVMEV